MVCAACQIHNTLYGVTKKSQARPVDDIIVTSSRKVRTNNVPTDGPIPTSSRAINPALIRTLPSRSRDHTDTP